MAIFQAQKMRRMYLPLRPNAAQTKLAPTVMLIVPTLCVGTIMNRGAVSQCSNHLQ